MNSVFKKNKFYTIISYIFYVTATLSSSGTLFQTFLVELGFTSNEIFIHSSILQITTVITILSASKWADTPSIVKRTAFSLILPGIIFFIYLPFCFIREATITAFVLICAVSVSQSFFIALYTVCDYKLPYYLFEPQEYGGVLAICGVWASIVSFGVGILMSALTSTFDYIGVMIVVFILSAILLIASGVFRGLSKPITDLSFLNAQTKKNVSIREIFTHPAFYQLLPAHFLRGYSMGVIAVLAVIAADTLKYSASVTSAMVAVSAFTTAVGCLIYGLLTKKAGNRPFIFIGSLTFLLIPILLVPSSPILFLVIYGIVVLGRTFIDYSVPTAMIYIVPVEIAGPYNAWRMAINSLAIVVASLLATVLSPKIFLLSALASQLISGVIYTCVPVMNNKSRFRGI